MRPFEDRDLDAWAAINADAEVMRYFPKTMTRGESAVWLEKVAEKMARDGIGFAAMELSGECIGMCGLSKPGFEAPHTPCVEIGWRLAPAHWGKGLVTEAAREWLRYGFEDYGLSEILSFASPANTNSTAVMERLGMTHDQDGTFMHPDLPEGSPLNPMVLYRLTREEFFA
ncbi:MAG: GNAT family N-acetyltransferase [Pseudomonadota bacterium]